MNEVKPSSMDEFEKQLEQSNVIDLDSQIENKSISRLKENKINVIDGSKEFERKVPTNQPVQNPNQNMVKVQKNIVLAFISDATGCGFIRCFQPFSYLNFVFGKSQQLLPIISSAFIQDQNILLRTRTVYFQRQMSPEHLRMVQWYKQNQATFKYKMVWEMDDHIFWEDMERKTHGVPPYNFGAKGITEDVKHACIQIMNMMDQLIVTTNAMKYYYEKHLNIKVPIKVIPNHVAKYFWKDGIQKKITEKIVKPKIIYTGSPTHYNNETKMYGDWQNQAWREYIIKNVKEDKISFTCMGGLPWFFEEIKDKIKVIGWLNSFQYHIGVMGEKADFSIMPLIPNWFNYCKSDLKHIENCAAKYLSIGSYFPENEHKGPYENIPVKLKWNCSLKDIEDTIEFYSHPENYNKIIDQQTKWLDDEGRWLESPKWVNNFLTIL